MRSDMIKKGFDKAPHRSLLKATGLKDEDFDKPFIAICNSFIEIIPGHKHLNEFGKLVKEAVRASRYGTIRIQYNWSRRWYCDGTYRYALFATES